MGGDGKGGKRGRERGKGKGRNKNPPSDRSGHGPATSCN